MKKGRRGNILPCLPASERARSYPIRLIIWRRRYTDARSRDCGKRFEVSVSRLHPGARNLRITPQFFVKSWQALPTAAFQRRLAPSVSSFNSTSRHGSGAFFSISKRRLFLARPEHGDLLSNGTWRFRIMRIRRKKMRVFAIACLSALVIAVGTAAILDNFVQKSATVAFAEPTARV